MKDEIKTFIAYCDMLIDRKEKGEIREEAVAYEIVQVMLTGKLSGSPLCAAIFDSAADVELPRELSHDGGAGKWDAKTADKIKQKEWRELVGAIEDAKKSIAKHA